MKQDILSLPLTTLQASLQAMGEPRFRAEQIYTWLHVKRVTEFSQMTNLSSSLRARLDEQYSIPRLIITRRLSSQKDGTVKYLYRLSDGEHVETVLMSYEHGWRLCISTQVGCKMGCRFCASAIAGYVRNLSVAEMLLQIDETERDKGIHISGIVLMGIGEPLDNEENVMCFLDMLSDPKGRGMSLRNVTLSTCGIVPRIRKLADRRLGLTLAVSLHQARNEGRSALMPVNRRYPLEDLMQACRYYFEKTGRRVTYEYAVIAGENDKDSDAKALASLLQGQKAHVNLIPVNAVEERSYRATRRTATDFLEKLRHYGIVATVRRTLGSDINAACGQLRRETTNKEVRVCDAPQRQT